MWTKETTEYKIAIIKALRDSGRPFPFYFSFSVSVVMKNKKKNSNRCGRSVSPFEKTCLLIVSMISFTMFCVLLSSCQQANQGSTVKSPTSAGVVDNISDAEATENCLRLFDAVFPYNCAIFDDENSPSVTAQQMSCQRYPIWINYDLELNFYENLAHKFNMCDLGKAPHLTYQQYVEEALEFYSSMMNTTISNSSIEGIHNMDELSKFYFSDNNILDTKRSVSLALQDFLERGEMGYHEIIPDQRAWLRGELLFYFYTKLCLESSEPICPGMNSTYDKDALIETHAMLANLFSIVNFVIKPHEVDVAGTLQLGLLRSKILVNSVAYYYNNNQFPNDIETILNYTDYNCYDFDFLNRLYYTFHNNVQAYQDIDDEPEDIIIAGVNISKPYNNNHTLYELISYCENAKSTSVSRDTRISKNGSKVYSEYDYYSFLYLHDPQQYRISFEDSSFLVTSNGLDALPDTDDDIAVFLDEGLNEGVSKFDGRSFFMAQDSYFKFGEVENKSFANESKPQVFVFVNPADPQSKQFVDMFMTAIDKSAKVYQTPIADNNRIQFIIWPYLDSGTGMLTYNEDAASAAEAVYIMQHQERDYCQNNGFPLLAFVLWNQLFENNDPQSFSMDSIHDTATPFFILNKYKDCLNYDEFMDDLQNHTYRKNVESDINLAFLLKVVSTPTMIVTEKGKSVFEGVHHDGLFKDPDEMIAFINQHRETP